jgi:methionyl-tRNA formyltransferase
MNIEKPIRAVFFCDLSGSAAHHIGRWLSAGHDVCACVITREQSGKSRRQEQLRHWLAPEWSLIRTLARGHIPLFKVERSELRTTLPDKLRALRADVLVSVAFPHLIPGTLSELFPYDGVNLHPALLPQYRGPYPLHVMALDGALDTAAGVTLHRLTDRFDEGDIIAQTPIQGFDAENIDSISMASTRAGAELLVGHLPRFCSGEIKAQPQSFGNWRYARLMPDDLVLSPERTIDDIIRHAKILGPLGWLSIEIGSASYRIGGVPRRWQHTRLSRGNPHRATPLSVEFDAADGRLRLLRRRGPLKTYEDLCTMIRLRQETIAMARAA